MPLAEYDALLRKVDAATAALEARCRAELCCRSGCAGCCHVDLSISPVEAAALRRFLATLPAPARERLRARRPPSDRCVMLEDDDTCAVYAARPLVCRTQGLALRYPAGLIPAQAVRLRVSGGDVACCPLNFARRPPTPAEVLDAGRVDELLALVNRRHAERNALDPLGRETLRSLAAAE